jgi:hypothetical protein
MIETGTFTDENKNPAERWISTDAGFFAEYGTIDNGFDLYFALARTIEDLTEEVETLRKRVDFLYE